jgi:hypothetical protein
MATLYNTDRILLDYDVPYELFKEKYLPDYNQKELMSYLVTYSWDYGNNEKC